MLSQGLTPGQIAAADAGEHLPATPAVDKRSAELGLAHVGNTCTDWLLFNDFCINPVDPAEVVRMYGQCKVPKSLTLTYNPITILPPHYQIPITNPNHPPLAPQVPVLCAYTRVDKPPPDPLPPSPITAGMYRRLTMDPNLPPYGSRCPFMPFTFESPGETPGAGTVLGEFILIYPRTGNWTDTCVLCTGIDAEFVSLAPAVKEPHPEVSLFYILCIGNVTDVVFF